MSWTQVYVSGLPQTSDPQDEELEQALSSLYNLDDEACSYTWAGPGTTIIKRCDNDADSDRRCRGYCFLVFLTASGAALAVDRINDGGSDILPLSSSIAATTVVVEEKCGYRLPLGLRLQAEISQPKKRTKKKPEKKQNESSDSTHVRMRRRRAAPERKHPIKARKNCIGSSKPAT